MNYFYGARGLQAAWALLMGYTPSLEATERRKAIALVTVSGVTQVVFGFPNEEAYWRDPRGQLGHGVYEILGSRWVDGINSYNQRPWGAAYPSWSPTDSRERHFFIGSKDSSAQFLAHDLTLEVFVDSTFEAVRAEALRRLDR